ncbi:MAG: GPR endopeptidase [Ruminococcaceae bacterium]|nr:GPR endopeptidase [Oscillospiraceae bacterium]
MKRTDLAIENLDFSSDIEGLAVSETEIGDIKITAAEIKSDSAAERLGRAKGRYITLETGDIASELFPISKTAEVLAKELRSLMGEAESALVIGLGNTDITPDALGPMAADRVLATRHLSSEIKDKTGLSRLRSVSVLSPGVLGQTGMESAEVIKAICREIEPDIVIAIDALAAADIERLGKTVQLSDAGISPGSGVGNRRRELGEGTLGRRVIAIGIPTVADSSCFGGSCGYIVTPREIDMLISRAGELISTALNFALQPEIDRDILLSLV